MSSRILSKRQAWFVVVASFAVLCLGVFLHRAADNPEGRYLDDKIGSTGLSYFEFKDGKVSLVLLKEYKLGSEEIERKAVATYFKREGCWVVTSMGYSNTLKAGLLSIRYEDSSGKVEAEFPRLISIGGRVIHIYSP